MARVPISTVRERELEKAAYEAFNVVGFRGIALHEIAKRAGTAKGTIHHYFRNKEDLIERTARYALREFWRMILDLLKHAESPSERIWSIIVVNLHARFLQPITARGFTLILIHGIRYKGVPRIYAATHNRMISNLAFALRQLVEPEDVQPIARTICAMLDGAWLLQVTQEADIAESALDMLADYLKNTVPGFDSSVVQNLDHFPAGPTPSNNRT